ncbi:cation:proton antiporter regulatory subunit [Heliorestis acidaminivorans]|uniref:Cation:proton antiporter regulatory subunit n=1 Tax=Heliorestis acidaminivorans TaxID=553427 RepID=A0A6I0EXB9_9FIRM|nr:TrkA C-terminal domain-containing protein [Heliorestis acidaminivorans]KAB2952920.1 cation:proton antiporter regulatory subunit [Heliorestis acidaminivorans]
MQVNITDLPGVGKKISFVNANNKKMVLIIHHTGKRELYFFEDDDDDAIFCFELTSEETKLLASQLLGATFEPLETEKLERVNMARNQYLVEWIDVAKHSRLAGMKVSDFRKRIPEGVTLIGIFRHDDLMVHPEPDAILETTDTIMVVGKRESMQNFVGQCKGKGKVN